MLNSTETDMMFRFKEAPINKKWVLKIDTDQPTPLDIYPINEYKELVNSNGYLVGARSLVLLQSVKL